MPDDLSTLRTRARDHQAALEARATGLTVRELAARWACAPSSVRAIPRARLAYVVIGAGARREHRRYQLADVVAYEQGRATAGRAA